MIDTRHRRFGALAGGLLLGTAIIAAPNLAAAVDMRSPAPPAAPAASSAVPSAGTVKHTRKKHPKKPQTTTQKNSSAEDFLRGYRVAYNLVYKHHDYAAGIAKLRSLGHDEHSDVATTIGYASRKLGRYDDAKYWYDKALAGDPTNARTLSYYGMWHAEQGNVLKARDYLAQVQSICGNTTCREYAALKDAIDGSGTY